MSVNKVQSAAFAIGMEGVATKGPEQLGRFVAGCDNEMSIEEIAGFISAVKGYRGDDEEAFVSAFVKTRAQMGK
ncbi:hypothetical protein [Limimaricola cinnabarinus]|uniref:hypothetical protein n=1 Tax=Limimaricola cinnabarinus TaxID=1125964 RepID=UPI0024932A7C|nr:hypothetical protein [Limimaricola cinnabarinus]